MEMKAGWYQATLRTVCGGKTRYVAVGPPRQELKPAMDDLSSCPYRRHTTILVANATSGITLSAEVCERGIQVLWPVEHAQFTIEDTQRHRERLK